MGRKMQTEKVHDRRADDLPINSKVVSAVVEDPFPRIEGRIEYIQVTRSVRDDPLADMFSRRVIDKAHYEAGRKWQRLHDITTIGPISAIDPTKEAVDGGKPRDPITDRQMDAFKKLAEADRMLGQWGALLVRDLLAHRLTVSQMCERHDCRTGRRANFLSLRVRECLEDLGKHWGFIG